MSFGERLFRAGFLLVLMSGLGFALYHNDPGWSALFGLLLGTALERLIP